MSLAERISEHLLNLPPERQAEVLDFVLTLEQRGRKAEVDEANGIEARRRRLLEALDALRQSTVYADISDPISWQRELRRDR